MGQNEFEAIKSLLEKSGVSFELLVHEASFSSAESAKNRGTDLHAGVKAMVVASNSGKFYLFCLPADMRLDLKKAAELANEKRVFLAFKEDVLRITGCEVGSCSPFSGLISDLSMFLDRSVLENDLVVFNLGLHTHSCRMKSADLVALSKPQVAVFSSVPV
ncbi:MAG: YbaK/EbsC family protein [Candidatus Diapherotrites archaeon]|nr:YbaK/EbsC family protein [Candidatus Diapherotrites archaeon]